MSKDDIKQDGSSAMTKFLSYVGVFLFGIIVGSSFFDSDLKILKKFSGSYSKASFAVPSTLQKEEKQVHAQPEQENTSIAPVRSLTEVKDDKKFGIYTVQVASYDQLKKAEELVAKLKYEHFDAYVAPDDLKNDRGWFRVYVGKYDNSHQAHKDWRQLRAEYKDSFTRNF